MENKTVAENKVINKGKMPENITSNGSTKPITLSVKLTAEENSRFSANLERSGISSKTEYVKHILFGNKPIITLGNGQEIFKKLSVCADLLNDIQEGIAPDLREKFESIAKQLSEIEADIDFIMSSLEAVQNGSYDEKEGE